MKLSHRRILLTGGATGIGLAMARRFVEEGSTVIICGRRQSALDQARASLPSLIAKSFDLELASERTALFHWIEAEHPDLDVLVNNAGIQNWMNVSDEDFYERAHEEVSINVIAPMHLSHLFLRLPSLKTIMNVSSGLAFVPLVKTPVYSATKAFLHSWTLSLREQLRERGVEVIEAIPPALNTDLGGKGLHDFAPPVAEFIDAIFTQLKEGREQLTFGFTESAAQAGQEALGPVFARINGLASP